MGENEKKMAPFSHCKWRSGSSNRQTGARALAPRLPLSTRRVFILNYDGKISHRAFEIQSGVPIGSELKSEIESTGLRLHVRVRRRGRPTFPYPAADRAASAGASAATDRAATDDSPGPDRCAGPPTGRWLEETQLVALRWFCFFLLLATTLSQRIGYRESDIGKIRPSRSVWSDINSSGMALKLRL